MELEDIIAKIVAESGKTEGQVKEKISEKEAELDGLVSKVGAAHIVANELGVATLERKALTRFNVSDLKDAMNGVDIDLKVLQVYEAREFTTKDGRPGAVGSFLAADSTGRIRVALWNAHAKAVEHLNVGDVVRVSNAYTRLNRERVELNVARQGRIIINPEGIEVQAQERQAPKRVTLADAPLGDVIEVRAALVQYSDRPPFYDACPICGKGARDGECKTHGKVEPVKKLLFSAVIDDGTSSVRAVFFTNAAETMLGQKLDELVTSNNPFEKIELGKQYIFTGRIRRNEMFDRTEMTVFGVNEVDPEKEAAALTE